MLRSDGKERRQGSIMAERLLVLKVILKIEDSSKIISVQLFIRISTELMLRS